MVDSPAQGGDTRCPRCGGLFHCGMADASPCACEGIALTAGALATLRGRYVGCLCLDCLAAIAADPSRAEAPASR